MMKCHTLFEEFKKYEGQPVKIFADDGRVYCGIDAEAYENSVRLIDDCGRPVLVEYSHIDAVVEPQMRLRKCCRDHCDCDEDGGDISNGAQDRDYNCDRY